jgi:hypothetical protein
MNLNGKVRWISPECPGHTLKLKDGCPVCELKEVKSVLSVLLDRIDSMPSMSGHLKGIRFKSSFPVNANSDAVRAALEILSRSEG